MGNHCVHSRPVRRPDSAPSALSHHRSHHSPLLVSPATEGDKRWRKDNDGGHARSVPHFPPLPLIPALFYVNPGFYLSPHAHS